jgi:hypothetical protein
VSIWNPDISCSEFRRASRFIWRHRVLLASWQLLLVLWLAAGSIVGVRTWYLGAHCDPDFEPAGWISHKIASLYPTKQWWLGCSFGGDPTSIDLMISPSGVIRRDQRDYWQSGLIDPVDGAIPYTVYCDTQSAGYGIWEDCIRRFQPNVYIYRNPSTSIYSRRKAVSLDTPESKQLIAWVSKLNSRIGENARAYQNSTVSYWFNWDGIAHDSAMLLATGFFLSGFWFVPARFRATRRTRRAARGLCPRCTYDLAGLTAPICPECGQSIALAPGTI